MSGIQDKSISLMVTSPPYWQIKDYNDKSQIGRYDSFPSYIDNLNLVWLETVRVLQPGGVAAVNIGDQYARAAEYGRFKVISIQSEIIRAFEHMGTDYRGTIIWQKVTNTSTSGGGALMGSFPFPPGGVPKFDYEYILLFRKKGAPPRRDRAVKEKSRMSPEEWKTFFTGHWSLTPERQTLHPAPFPPELPTRLIRMFTFHGDTVLDPFLGSGTTALAAARLGRNSIGYEINPDFLNTAVDRLKKQKNAVLSQEKKNITPEEIEAAKKRLPYLCDDYLDIQRLPDEAIEKKKLPELLRIKEIKENFVVELSDGTSVRLAGVAGGKASYNEVSGFILKKGRSGVYFKIDDTSKQCSDEPLPVYLHAANRTNINWHLIREGLCEIDRENDFRFKQSFIKRMNGKDRS